MGRRAWMISHDQDPHYAIFGRRVAPHQLTHQLTSSPAPFAQAAGCQEEDLRRLAADDCRRLQRLAGSEGLCGWMQPMQ